MVDEAYPHLVSVSGNVTCGEDEPCTATALQVAKKTDVNVRFMQQLFDST
jgi:hypothetical protein